MTSHLIIIIKIKINYLLDFKDVDSTKISKEDSKIYLFILKYINNSIQIKTSVISSK